MRSNLGFVFILILCGACTAQAVSDSDSATVKIYHNLTTIPTGQWVSLFNGSTLTGWRSATTNDYEPSGAIVPKDNVLEMKEGDPYSYLIWTNDFPRDNYEFKLQAKRVDGPDIFCGILFPVGSNHVTLVIGGWANSVVGLSCVDFYVAAENSTTRFMSFESNKWYDVRVRVTPDRIESWISGKRVINQKRKDHFITPYPGLEFLAPFGLFNWITGSAVQGIKVRRLEPMKP